MRKPISTFIRRTAMSTAMLGALAASGVAWAGHSSPSGYTTWVDVVSVEPIYAEQVVHESVERCYDVSPPQHARAWGRRGRDDRRYDDRRYRQDDGEAFAATLLGGVIGGVIGNQLGGDGKNRGITAAGAVIGASIAHSAATSGRDHYRDRRHDRRYDDDYRRDRVSRRCEVTSEPRTVSYVDGYDVTYRYHGRNFTRVMDEHPGDRMRIRIDVQPI